MNKQIEEMAEAICGLNTSEGCFCDGGYCNHNCLAYEKATALYNAGYRKASTVAAEIFEEIKKYLIPHNLGAFNCIYLNDVLFELKKKYESEGA